MIRIDQLSYQIKSHKILDQISLLIPQGKMIGIIGANGSGKTTLLKHLCRRIPSSNHIYLEEQEINQYSNKELAKQISLLSQLNEISERNITVNDLVMMGRYPYKRLFETYNEDDQKLVENALQMTGMDGYQNRKISQLSGGEQQRVLIARAFAQQTPILFLDEPTNHLDIKYKQEIIRLLKEFQGTVILTIHDLNLAFNFCDLIIALKSGKVVKMGTPDELISAELLEELYGVSFKIRKDDNDIWIHY